jgi:hypothetical protein
MRKGKRTRPQLQSWLFALAVPAVGLFLLFSLMPYSRMVKAWPWGIGQQEVMAYQGLFDRRPGQHAEGHAEVLTIREEGDGGKVLLAAGTDSVQGIWKDLQIMDGPAQGGHVLELAPGDEFRGMANLVFVPAGLQSLDALYAQAVADSLPIRSPKIGLVQLVRNDGKPSPWLLQERVDPEYVLQHAQVATVLVDADGTIPADTSMGPSGDVIGEQRKPTVQGNRFDTSATAALGLLAIAGQRSDLLDGSAGALYDRVTAQVDPLYGLQLGGPRATGALSEAFRSALAARGTEARIRRLGQGMLADSAAWDARFRAIDSVAVPVLAQGRNLGLVQAEVDHRRMAFLQRLLHPDPEVFLGKPVDVPAPQTPGLDPWLAQFRTNPDTIRFVRGKYTIDHDLVLPHGMAVVLEKGTRWFMAPGVSVVVNGELHMRGTDLNPVFIRPLSDSAAFGSIAVNGNGSTRVRIRGLRISGGSDLVWNGIRYGGMLSFHRSDVRMDHCTIDGSFGSASVGLRRCSLAMNDCQIAGSAHAAVDASETAGAVERCSITASGSGMVLRAGRFLLRGCAFSGLRGAAVRAAYQCQALLSGCSFNGNGTAVAVSDGSTMHVDGCDFTSNGKVFVLRQERPVLGGARVKLYTNTFTGNATQQDSDAASQVETIGTLLPPALLKEFPGKP